jgi:hypothetical protein
MKRKLIVAGAVVVGLVAGLMLVVGLMKSSQNAAQNYYQVSTTADGRLIVQPPDQPTSVVMSKASVTNVPAAAR